MYSSVDILFYRNFLPNLFLTELLKLIHPIREILFLNPYQTNNNFFD